MAKVADVEFIFTQPKMLEKTIDEMGVLVFLPLLITIFTTPFTRANWSRQGLLLSITAMAVGLLWRPIAIFWSLSPMLIFLIINCFREKPTFRLRPDLIPAGLMVVWMLISIAWSADPQKGLAMTADRFPLFFLILIPCLIQFTADERIRIMKTFCYSAAIFIVLSFISFGYHCIIFDMAPWEWPLLHKELVNGDNAYDRIFLFLGGWKGYTHPSYNTLPLFLASSMACWMAKHRHFNRVLASLFLPATAILVLYSQSRMGLIYVIILMIAATIYAIPYRKWKIATAVFVCVFVFVAGICLQSNLKEMGSDEHRDRMNKMTIEYIHHKPLTGSGAGALNPIEICRTIDSNEWPHVGEIDTTLPVSSWSWKTRMLPHNQFLAECAQTGIVGLLILLYLYIAIACEAFRSRRFWAGYFVLVFIIFSMLEPPLFIAKGMYSLGLVALLMPVGPQKRI